MPHDGETEDQEPMSDRQFYIGLALALAVVVAAGVLIRGCAI